MQVTGCQELGETLENKFPIFQGDVYGPYTYLCPATQDVLSGVLLSSWQPVMSPVGGRGVACHKHHLQHFDWCLSGGQESREEMFIAHTCLPLWLLLTRDATLANVLTIFWQIMKSLFDGSLEWDQPADLWLLRWGDVYWRGWRQTKVSYLLLTHGVAPRAWTIPWICHY